MDEVNHRKEQTKTVSPYKFFIVGGMSTLTTAMAQVEQSLTMSTSVSSAQSGAVDMPPLSHHGNSHLSWNALNFLAIIPM